MIGKLIKRLIWGSGLLLLVYMLLLFAWEGSKMATWYRSGTAETDVYVSEDSALVISEVGLSEYVTGPPPLVGDTIIAVNDTITGFESMLDELAHPKAPGDTLTFTYLHEGEAERVQMVLKAVTIRELLPFLALQILRFLIVLSFIAVGLWAFNKQPESPGVRALTLFCM